MRPSSRNLTPTSRWRRSARSHRVWLRSAAVFSTVALGMTALGPVASASGSPGFVPLATYTQPDNVPGPLACSGSFCLLIAYTGAETDVNTPADLAGVLVSTDGGESWQDRGVPTLLADMLQFPPADLASGAIHLECTSATTCLVAQYGWVARHDRRRFDVGWRPRRTLGRCQRRAGLYRERRLPRGRVRCRRVARPRRATLPTSREGGARRQRPNLPFVPDCVAVRALGRECRRTLRWRLRHR